MLWSPFQQRLVSARLAGAAMFLGVSLGVRSLPAQQTMERTAPQDLEPVQVFATPSAEQLSKITHPDLRIELLRMAEEDQAARSAAT